MTRVMIAVVAVALGGCATLDVHLKGPPVRVKVDKTASEPRRVAAAARDGHAVVVRIADLVEVGVERDIRYSTLTSQAVHTWNPLWELLEIPMGALFLASPAIYFWVPPLGGVDQEVDFKAPPFLALISPFHGFLALNNRIMLTDADVFPHRRVSRAYLVRLPVEEVALKYRVLDAGRVVLADGDAVTDVFGKLVLDDVPATAVGIQLIADDWTTIVAIDGTPPVPPPTPTPPPPPTP